MRGESGDSDAGCAEEVVLGQVAASLAGLEVVSADSLVVAYEPVWAIGTGRTATAADAEAMSAAVRGALVRLFPSVGADLRILYGGSMKPSNARELLEQPNVNGGLIGGASLDLNDYLAIAEAAR